eukprot:44085_1
MGSLRRQPRKRVHNEIHPFLLLHARLPRAVRRRVKYDAVVNATYSADSDNDLPGTPVDKDIWNNAMSTVLGAFDTIQRSLDEEADGLRVKYDRDTGYPASVYIDWEEMIADEETSFSINNVVLSDDTAIISDAPSTASPSKTPSASPVTIALIPVGGDKELLAPAPITSDQSASPITSESMSKTTSGPSKAPTVAEALAGVPSDAPSLNDEINGSIRLTTTTTVLLSLAFLVVSAMG